MDSIIIDEEEGTATIMSIAAVDYAFTRYSVNPLIEIVPECIVCKVNGGFSVYVRNNAPSNKKHYQLKISDDVLMMLKLGDI